MATGSATQNLQFGYDRYGNMACQTDAQTNGPCPNWTFNTSTNRISNANFTYDAAGNLTQDGTGAGTHTYQWDGEGRLTSVDSGTTASYTYNALGQRVEKKVGTAYTEIVYEGSGEPIGENNRTSWTQSYVLLAGRHVAIYQNNATYFTHANRLGSTGSVTDYSATVVQDQLFYPWGQDWLMVGSSQEKRFAKLQHRDSETSLDPTRFRMFSSTQGRWLSPDPAGKRAAKPANPQSWNRYAYVLNNACNGVDPLGLFAPGPCLDPNAPGCGDPFLDLFFLQILFEDRFRGSGPFLFVGGGGGGRGSPRVTITNATQGGKEIGAIIKRLLDRLKDDSKCASFLSGKEGEALTTLTGIYEGGYYGHADISVNGNNWQTAAVPGQVANQAFTINDNGGFYKSSVVTASGITPLVLTGTEVRGGSELAQGLTILHELGHLTNALPGDLGKLGQVARNNQDVLSHCSKTFSGFKD